MKWTHRNFWVDARNDHLDALHLAVLIKNFNFFQNLPDTWVYNIMHVSVVCNLPNVGPAFNLMS
jgi:hypothetical protein